MALTFQDGTRAAAVVALFAAPAAAQEDVPRLESVGAIAPGFVVADWRVVSAGDGGQRILFVGREGELALAVEAEGGFAPLALPLAAVAQPARTLLDTGAWLGVEAQEVLVAADPTGLWIQHLAPPPPPDTNQRRGEPIGWQRVAERARFDLRTGRPMFADLLDDVNGDGLLDVVLPSDQACELWLATARDPDSGASDVSLVRAGRIRVAVTSSAQTAADALSDRLVARFSIPHLSTADLDGDGRPDLLVSDGSRRAFHLQAPDGTFPVEPTVEVDLALFRDPGAADGSFRFGGTLTVTREAQLTRRDLDGDGRADFVLAHGRKVWVFHGTESGPQFSEPSAILKTADDVTVLLLARLDDDVYPDLLLLRVELPSIPTLLMGLFAEWDVKVRASGYRNTDGRRFELRPSFVRDLALRVPPLFDLLRDPYAIVERFQGAGARFRSAIEGDFDGDGALDLALVDETSERLDVWFGSGGATGSFDRDRLERILAEQLFGDGSGVWDIDRLLGWVEGLAAERDERLTAGRPPDATFALTSPSDEGAEGRAKPRLVRTETVLAPSATRALLVLEWVRPGDAPVFELVGVGR